MPLITTGFGVVATFAVQLTLFAPPWPELPVAARGPTLLLPVSPTVPGAFPWPLFQW